MIHIRFDPSKLSPDKKRKWESLIAVAETEKGRATRDVCRLDRDELNREREKQQRKYYLKWLAKQQYWVDQLGVDEGRAKALEEIRNEVNGSIPYSAAVESLLTAKVGLKPG